MTIVRTITRDEVDGVAELTARVFGNDDDRESIHQMMRFAMLECPFIPPELCWVADVDGRIVAKWQVLDFQLRIGGTPIRVGGIQGVVAEPDENHKGYAKRIAMEALPQLAAMGFDFLLGFAQRGGFYRRIGAVPVMAEYELQLDARQIPRLRDDPFREFQDEDLTLLVELFNEGNASRSGSTVRTEALWPWLVRKAPVHHIYEDGYIGVRHNEDDLEIRELAGRSQHFAELALRKLGHLAREQGVRKIRGAVPADHPLVKAALPYGASIESHYTKKSGCIALPTDPLRTLRNISGELESRLAASAHRDHAIDLGVHCDGVETRLSLGQGGAKMRKLDVTFSRGGLSQLIFGYRSVESVLVEEAVERTGSATQPTLPDAEELALLDTLLPHGHPFMWQTDRY
jgi:predicted N-acetyltransferase YhbS